MRLRSIVTPVTIGSFLGVAITGIILFYRLKPNLVHLAHEWMGLVFTAIALWHAATHWRSLANYTRRRLPAAIIISAILAAAGFTAITSAPDNGSPREVLQALARQPVENIAAVLGTHPEKALAALKAEGIHITGNQPLEEAARAAKISPNYALTVVLRANAHAVLE